MNTVTVSPRSTFFGTRVVRAAFVLAVFGWGVGFYGPPVYLAEVINRTGWSIDLVSTAVTVHFLIGALVIAILPRIHARIGLPRITVAGAIITAIGVLGWAIAWEPWQLFMAALLTGMGWVTMGAVAVNAIVSPWYVRNRPSALSKAYNGASIGGVIFSPLWVALIGGLGFAGASGLVGIVMIGIMLVLSRHVFATSPEDLGQYPDGGHAPANQGKEPPPAQVEPSTIPLWRNRAFVTLAAAMAIGLFAQIGLLAHLFKLLIPALGAQDAGLLLGFGTACGIAGRFVAARAMARFGERRMVAAAGYAFQALGSAALLLSGPEQTWLIVLGVMLFGSGIGNATSIPPLIAQIDFAAKDVPRVIARIIAIAQGTYAFAPAVFGILQSSTTHHPAMIGDSAMLFVTAIAIQLVAAAMFLAGRKR